MADSPLEIRRGVWIFDSSYKFRVKWYACSFKMESMECKSKRYERVVSLICSNIDIYRTAASLELKDSRLTELDHRLFFEKRPLTSHSTTCYLSGYSGVNLSGRLAFYSTYILFRSARHRLQDSPRYSGGSPVTWQPIGAHLSIPLA